MDGPGDLDEIPGTPSRHFRVIRVVSFPSRPTATLTTVRVRFAPGLPTVLSVSHTTQGELA
jgi:hypothetical protein